MPDRGKDSSSCLAATAESFPASLLPPHCVFWRTAKVLSSSGPRRLSVSCGRKDRLVLGQGPICYFSGVSQFGFLSPYTPLIARARSLFKTAWRLCGHDPLLLSPFLFAPTGSLQRPLNTLRPLPTCSFGIGFVSPLQKEKRDNSVIRGPCRLPALCRCRDR